MGKLNAVIKKEGWRRGGKKLIKALFAMVRFSGSGDILFITGGAGGVGDSSLYRTGHVAEELSLHGFKCACTVQDNLFLAIYAHTFKVFIFHRTLFTGKISQLIGELKKQNKEIIFETDDLIFDSKYLDHMDYFKNMTMFEKKGYEKGVGGEILNDSYTKVCTTTTSFLANKLRDFHKKVFIVSNKLSIRDVALADKLLNDPVMKRSHEGIVKVGYFSGTLSHNKDFATITDALIKIMETYTQVRLCLVGPLDIESKLNQFKDRIEQLPYVPRQEHFANIAKVDINLVPLELNNPFCESKSELKFFEAGIVKVPTVAVANQTFIEAIEDGVDGFVASTTEEWVEKLAGLITDDGLRKKMGKKAREKALRKYTVKNSNNTDYYYYLRSKL